uniref:Uncharacterized protein n=1 Tax=Anguilla anguilla TaxID=7936 RepID=A0A0E9V8L5_ANGAN
MSLLGLTTELYILYSLLGLTSPCS